MAIETDEAATAPSPDDLMTAGQVRQRFGGISAQTLWNWEHGHYAEGFPQPIRINRRRYWRAGDIEDFIQGREG